MKPEGFLPKALLLMAVVCATSDAVAQSWLVSPQEVIQFQGEAGFLEPGALRPRAVLPLIDIITPEAVPDLKVKAPFPIVVRFKAQPDSAIEPSTFKVLYGGLKLDITQRITQFVTITKEGFEFKNAKLPTGRHRLILQIQDEKQRFAERELKFEVE